MESTTGRGVARALLVAILLSLTFNGTWFEVIGKGVYTEGLEREPTIWANYTVDAEDEVIEVQITNATPLIHYWSQRESDLDMEPPKLDTPCGDGCVNQARSLLQICAIVLLLLESVLIFRTDRWLRRLSIGAFGVGLVTLLVLIPLAVFADFGMTEDEQATGGFESGKKDAAQSTEMVHRETSESVDWSLSGVRVEFRSAGYDLGLIEEENRSAAIENPPEDDSAWIGFEGSLTVSHGNGVGPWFGIPVLWFILRTTPDEMLDDHEGRIRHLEMTSEEHEGRIHHLEMPSEESGDGEPDPEAAEGEE
jgi:hypothetical protein